MGLVQRVSGRKVRGGKLIEESADVKRIRTDGSVFEEGWERVVLCCV